MEALVPPDKVREIRRVIDGLLREQHVYSEIRNILTDYAQESSPGLGGPDALLDVVQERGIIDSVLGSLDPDAQSGRAQRKTPGRRFLHVRLLGGRAFLENLDTDPTQSRRERLLVSCHFGSQRFRSNAVECVCDPPFDDDFLVDLDEEVGQLAGRYGGQPDSVGNRDLLRLETRLHFVVTRYDPARCTTRYVGENSVDWRSVLKQGGLSQEIQIGPLSVPAGVLMVQLELVPTPPAASTVPEEDLLQQRASEGTNQQAGAREFWAYARRWWQEFHQLSPHFEKRNVKVYAELLGPSMNKVPVTSLITVLKCSRVLDSPSEAFRFVSLMAYDVDDERTRAGAGVTGDSPEAWAPPFVLLCRGKGTTSERAPLLCSLLLGFGLDAWVATGLDNKDTAVTWVLTRTYHAQADIPVSITFWDLSTGMKWASTGSHPFKEVHACYSHLRFVACLDQNPTLEHAEFDFGDERRWKEMSPIKLRLPTPVPYPPILPASRPRVAEDDIEGALAGAIGRHRDALGLPTTWDQARGYLTGQHLWKCEMERLTGTALEDHSFAAAVRNSIPSGSTFSAFPVHFTHSSAGRMLSRMTQDYRIRQVLEQRGDDVRLTLRVKVFVYPEDVLSVWVMVSASCRPS